MCSGRIGVIDETFDLFVELGANDEQCDFPVVYASGVNGVAGETPEDMADTLEPLFEAVVKEVWYYLDANHAHPYLQTSAAW